MNRDFVYNHGSDQRPSGWSRAGSTLHRWLWGALCCGVPGVPCYFCNCCERLDDSNTDSDRPRMNQSTATAERLSRPHRPHAPRRKSTPELRFAVRSALNQLQEGEPAPYLSQDVSVGSKPEPG